MFSQRLWGPQQALPEQTVGWLTAVQAQDYGAAKWGVALRTRGSSEALLETALQEGRILRTHVLRPTWHFVRSADIRWLLTLSAARVRAALAPYDAKLGLDAETLSRSHEVLHRALQGGQQRTRGELATQLEQSGVAACAGQRLGHLMMHAELSAVVCSGARRGKQSTYALLDERAPSGRNYTREQALAELSRRYFTSRGPASLHDFAWWSGLTIADAKLGLEQVVDSLQTDELDGKKVWSARDAREESPERPSFSRAPEGALRRVLLLPNFDEYVIAYKHHELTFAPEARAQANARGLAGHFLLLDGRVVGSWRRTLDKSGVAIAVHSHLRLDQAQRDAVRKSADDYAKFTGLSLSTFSWT